MKQKNKINSKYIPKDMLLAICMYLDPYTMANFSMSGAKIWKCYSSQIFGQYFKQLCINLFEKNDPKLPDPSRFIQVRKYVMKPGNGFGPNSKNAVTNNLRYYVWQRAVHAEKKTTAFLQSFGSYRSLFFKLPRVHFNGLYVCKHEYRKEQQKNLITNTMQVHVVSYYRYFRFLQDGSVLSAVYPNKQKLGVIANQLTQNVLHMEAEKIDKSIMVGEYLQTENNIQAKLFKQGAIFTFQLEISKSQQNNKNQICNNLIVKKYYLKVVDEKQIVQVLEEHNEKSLMVFKYFYSPIIRKQNSKMIKSSSL